MKALKNENKVYFDNILAAIQNCYSYKEPSNSDIMSLYNEIGRQISMQGEKAFVVHLEQLLKTEYPQLKGFSARNIRRMRDFYLTYKGLPTLMEKAKKLNFTINSIILEQCQSDTEREFYLELAEKNNLSKLSLIAAIEVQSHLQTETKEETTSCDSLSAPVCDFEQAVEIDTTTNKSADLRAVVRAFDEKLKFKVYKLTLECRALKLYNIIYRVLRQIRFYELQQYREVLLC